MNATLSPEHRAYFAEQAVRLAEERQKCLFYYGRDPLEGRMNTIRRDLERALGKTPSPAEVKDRPPTSAGVRSGVFCLLHDDWDALAWDGERLLPRCCAQS